LFDFFFVVVVVAIFGCLEFRAQVALSMKKVSGLEI